MVRTALWRRLDTPGHDAAKLDQTEDGWRLDGVAVFLHPEGPARVRYTLELAPSWETRTGQIVGVVGTRAVEHSIVRTDAGWKLDGREVPGLDRTCDLDLGFTPATNMPQLQRLALATGQTADFEVAWFDVEGEAPIALRQIYERRDERSYDYRSPQGAYEAVLEIGEDGFVVDYPTLWRREDQG